MTMPDKRAAASVRTALGGRMRDSLFGLSTDFPAVVELELGRIQPNPQQPRRIIDPEALAELASSIRQHGLLQPIVVRELEGQAGRYLLVAGQRRLLACRQLERETIFAIVTEGAPDELALIENLQRQDLDPLDEADAMARLMAAHRYTQEQLGRVLGRKQNTISETLSLGALPDAIKADYRASDTRVAKAVLVELARVKDAERQLTLWREVRHGGTLRQVRARKSDSEASASAGPARLIASGRRLVRALQRLQAAGEPPDDDQRRALRALRAELDLLIDRYVSAESVTDEPGARHRTSDTLSPVDEPHRAS